MTFCHSWDTRSPENSATAAPEEDLIVSLKLSAPGPVTFLGFWFQEGQASIAAASDEGFALAGLPHHVT